MYYRNTTIKGYIADALDGITEANSVEHRPTRQAELDNEKEACTRMYLVGQEFMADLSQDDLGRCLRMERIRNDYGADCLIQVKISEKWMIVPRYVACIEEMRKLREAVM